MANKSKHNQTRSRLSIAKKVNEDAERAFYKIYDELHRCEKEHPNSSALEDFVTLNPSYLENGLIHSDWGPLTKKWFELMNKLQIAAKEWKRAELELNLATGAVVETIDEALKY